MTINIITLFFCLLFTVFSSQQKSSLDFYDIIRTAQSDMPSDAFKSYISCYDGCWFLSNKTRCFPITLKSNTALKASFIIKKKPNTRFWVKMITPKLKASALIDNNLKPLQERIHKTHEITLMMCRLHDARLHFS